MKRHKLNILIIIILIIGLVLSGELVYRDYIYGDICPKIGILPACYLILFYFIVLLGLNQFRKDALLFFLFAGFALAVAIFGSIGQLIGKIECPKTNLGFPLCYLSFLIFSSLIFLKFLEEKRE